MSALKAKLAKPVKVTTTAAPKLSKQTTVTTGTDLDSDVLSAPLDEFWWVCTEHQPSFSPASSGTASDAQVPYTGQLVNQWKNFEAYVTDQSDEDDDYKHLLTLTPMSRFYLFLCMRDAGLIQRVATESELAGYPTEHVSGVTAALPLDDVQDIFNSFAANVTDPEWFNYSTVDKWRVFHFLAEKTNLECFTSDAAYPKSVIKYLPAALVGVLPVAKYEPKAASSSDVSVKAAPTITEVVYGEDTFMVGGKKGAYALLQKMQGESFYGKGVSMTISTPVDYNEENEAQYGPAFTVKFGGDSAHSSFFTLPLKTLLSLVEEITDEAGLLKKRAAMVKVYNAHNKATQKRKLSPIVEEMPEDDDQEETDEAEDAQVSPKAAKSKPATRAKPGFSNKRKPGF